MKRQLSLRIVLTGVLVGLLSACAEHSPDGSPRDTGISVHGPLVGTWTNSLGTVWTIRADNTFDVVGSKRHLWGNLTLAGNTVTIQETGGKPAMLCPGPGVYKFNRTSHDTMVFTLVKDRCKERIKNVTLPQHLRHRE